MRVSGFTRNFFSRSTAWKVAILIDVKKGGQYSHSAETVPLANKGAEVGADENADDHVACG